MTIDERQRYQLHQTLETTLGPDAAATLMAYLPPVGWADVATKRDLAVLRTDLDALEQRMALNLAAEIAELRGALHTGLADVRTEIHTTARTMTFTFIGATTAIVTAIAALTNLFG